MRLALSIVDSSPGSHWSRMQPIPSRPTKLSHRRLRRRAVRRPDSTGRGGVDERASAPPLVFRTTPTKGGDRRCRASSGPGAGRERTHDGGAPVRPV